MIKGLKGDPLTKQEFKKMGMLPIFCVYHKISREVNLIFLYGSCTAFVAYTLPSSLKASTVSEYSQPAAMAQVSLQSIPVP